MKLSSNDIIIDGKILPLKSLVGKSATYLPTGETVEIQRAISKNNIQVKFFYTTHYNTKKLSAEYKVLANQLSFNIYL